MRKILLLGAFGMFWAAGAQASFIKVTNLDNVAHTVRYEAAGSAEKRIVQAGDTETFIGQPAGRISLVSAPQPKKATSPVQSDGLLADYIGNKRTEGIPAEPRDTFVIWPGGEFGIQRRQRTPLF